MTAGPPLPDVPGAGDSTPGSLAGLLRANTARHPDRPALTLGRTTLSWAELAARASRVGQALAAAGIRRGDRVAFLDRNSVEYFEVLFGGAMLGAVTVAVNWRLAPPEVAAVVTDAGARVLVVAEEFLPALETVADQLPTVRTTVVVGDHPVHEPYQRWRDRRPAADPGCWPAAAETALQLYTSGTTGLPKGVMLSNANLCRFFPMATGRWGFDRATVNLVAMPLFHIGGTGYALAGMYAGGHTVLLREAKPGPILAAVAARRVTHMFAVPAVLQSLLAAPELTATDVSSLRLILYGGSPISTEVLRRAIAAFGCDFAQAYGMTETTGMIVELPPGDHRPDGPHRHRLRSAGRPVDGVTLRVVDPETGRDRPAGEVGEVWVRSGQCMQGYWNQPAETAATVTADGWLRTGDAGYLDADGYLYIHDRVKDMVVSGGENVYPAEVEHALLSHPAVADACVVGVPDARWGETVKALVVPAGAEPPAPAELIGWARQRLAGYKCPTSVEFVPSLPRNASGKLLRRELRARFWQGRDRLVG